MYATTIGALYVIIPAMLALAAVLYATFCPVHIVEEVSPMVKVYAAVAEVCTAKASRASEAADYWERMVSLSVTSDARARAKAYAKMWRGVWQEQSERACRYKEASVG